ncbi:MAG TPA: GNAT family protein [Verrucomicrobiae bacterium]|jgi:[ribosomal protein S5]-alanine N-acetyltransferase|nr:GNAT family protein [Verrucomicrobiae bacterium]
MTRQPDMRIDVNLETQRLTLRSYSEADIAQLVPLIGAREVAATTGRIPHPYSAKDARQFLALIETDREVRLAITLRGDGHLIGGIGLRLMEEYQHAELGYWLGVPFWGHGYATEAAREMLGYGFGELRLHRIFASHFQNNPASANVLKKLGMKYEGCQRQHVYKFAQFLDLELYGLLRQEWEQPK